MDKNRCSQPNCPAFAEPGDYPLSDAALDAAITEAVGRTRLLYRGELPTGYKVSHHPTAATNRKWKGTYPGGRVWAANAHDVYRHLWMTLIGTQP